MCHSCVVFLCVYTCDVCCVVCCVCHVSCECHHVTSFFIAMSVQNVGVWEMSVQHVGTTCRCNMSVQHVGVVCEKCRCNMLTNVCVQNRCVGVSTPHVDVSVPGDSCRHVCRSLNVVM